MKKLEQLEPVFRAEVIEPNILQLKLANGKILHFYTTDHSDPPILPLRGYGQINLRGWDIPLGWAIDAEGRCWKDSAHGDTLHLCKTKELLRHIESEEQASHIRELAGLPLAEPSWMLKARAAGWRPPESKG